MEKTYDIKGVNSYPSYYLQRYQGAWYLCCFTLVPFTKKLGTFHQKAWYLSKKLGTFHEMYHAYHGIFLLEVVSFDQMYHAEVVSFC